MTGSSILKEHKPVRGPEVSPTITCTCDPRSSFGKGGWITYWQHLVKALEQAEAAEQLDTWCESDGSIYCLTHYRGVFDAEDLEQDSEAQICDLSPEHPDNK
jgi:hypothetical protein